MLRARFLSVVLLLAAAPLSGCIEGDPTAAPPVAAEGESEKELSMPDNRTGDFNAFKETNATEEGSGGIDHHHDSWLGRDRVEIFRGPAMMSVSPSPEGASVEFAMPYGALVFEGTSTVEFVVSNPERHVCEPSGTTFNTKNTCNDDNGLGLPTTPRVQDPAPPKLHLYYVTSADGLHPDDWRSGGELVWNEPLAISVLPVETDMPHSTASLWRFRVVSEQPIVDSTLTFEAAATIVRGEDVPLWPGHPDFYARKSWRMIYDGPASTRESGAGGPVFGYEDSLEQKTPNRLISYGTRTVMVWINVTKVSTAPGLEPTDWYLYFHNATGDWYAQFNESYVVGEVTEMVFIIPVDDNGMDSPYAPDSRWEFLLRGTKDLNPSPYTCYGGCATYAVEYQMSILATSETLESYPPIRDVS